MTDDNQIKELLQYNLSDEQIILKLQSNECTPDEITNTINTMKKIIFSAVFCNLFQAITYNTQQAISNNQHLLQWQIT